MKATDDRTGVFVPLWAMQECEGNARDAMVLAQISWWLQPGQRDGLPRSTHLADFDGRTWMYLTDAELGEQVGMNRGQVFAARTSLVKRGLVENAITQVDNRKVTLVRPTALRAISRFGKFDIALSESSISRFPPSIENHVEEENLRTSPNGDTLADEATTEQFDHFWKTYPPRNGKRLGKDKALRVFARLSLDDRRAAWRGAKHLRVAVDANLTLAPDAFRWLRDRSFEDWQEPATPTNGKTTPKPRRGYSTDEYHAEATARAERIQAEQNLRANGSGL